jgi:hypothetical protein
MVKNDNKKTPKNPLEYKCVSCNFICSNKKDYSRHLLTAKHKMITSDNAEDNKKTPKQFKCECGKIYKYKSGLSRHKSTCKKPHKDAPKSDNEMIQLLTKSNSEMKSMFMLMLETYQKNQIEMNQQNHENTMELVNKVVEAIPKTGNTINNNNNTYIERQTLNFYLTNTCKDAESIHDFTDRYIKKCVEFLKDNYRAIAYKQVDLPSNVYDMFFKCLSENPQCMRFIQTTDVKNGVLYIKEKKKNENRELYGDAEFIKYMDGFDKAGTNIGHAITKALNPLQLHFDNVLKEECGPEPCEDDYDDEDLYERDYDRYKSKLGDLQCQLMVQVFETANLFDNKRRCGEILSKTKRIKEE